MGAALSGYLDEPVTEKEVTDGISKLGIRYGASCMQGWRVGNEDALSCIPDLTDNSAMFAVYDGHGGPEVALYVAKYLPLLLKTQYHFNSGKMDAALKEAFLAVDKQVVLEETADELQILAGTKADDDDEDPDEKLKECEDLNQEAKMPLLDLLAKYKKKFAEAEAEEEEEEEFEGSGKGKKAKKENGDAASAVVANGNSDPAAPSSENGVPAEDGAADDTKEGAAAGTAADEEHGAEGNDAEEKDAEKVEDEDEMDDSDYAEGDEEEDDSEEDSDEDDDEEDESSEDDDEDGPAEFDEREGYGSGTTACVAVVKDGVITVANVGDSRCVICCKDGTTKDLSVDHKPESEIEKARVEKAGGTITKDGRINGGLNLARALGDHQYKNNTDLSPEEQMISPMPDVQTHTLNPEDEFMLIACDGIWNVLSSEEAVNFVRDHLQEATPEETSSKTFLSDIASKLLDKCMSPDTSGDGTGCDNMTCLIAMLNQDVSNLKDDEISKRKLEDAQDVPESKKSKTS